jgi:hypothetical protein
VSRSGRVPIHIAGAVLFGVLVALLFASRAVADTTIGQTVGNQVCAPGFVALDPSYAVPAGGGVITSFSYGNDGNNGGKQLDFEVLQPNADGSYTIVAHTGLQTLAGLNGVETFPADIPVSGGEVIGYFETGIDNCLGFDPSGTVFGEPFASDPGVGTAVAGSSFAYVLNESANLQTGAASLSASGTPVSATEGQPFSGQVAAFADADNQPASSYTATITWGDGGSSAGTVAQTGSGEYTVSGSNTYAEEGSDPVSVQISDSDGSSTQASSSATVADASLAASGTGSASSPVPTTPSFSGPVASLTDQTPGGSASDFTATIDWGDGSSSAGTVSGDGGSYTVGGSHSYAADGPYTVAVHVSDVGGSSADATTSLLVYDYADQSGGSFVIGDGVSGPGVYFWGAHWARHNPFSDGRAPHSFKGFADSSAQSCGASFSARRGERSQPPANIPAYMAVAVTGALSKSHHEISGTVEKLVVVKTDPGYGPEPGMPGTGQIVATICG